MSSIRTLKRQSGAGDNKSLTKIKPSSTNVISNNVTFKTSKTDFVGSRLVPEYHINNKDGYGMVIIKLKKGQTVGIAYSVLSYYDSSLDINTRSQNGVFKGIFRKMVTGDSVFKTFFTGTQNTNNELVLSHYLPGSIIPLIVKPGESYRIDNNSLLGYTSNLKIETKSKFRNILLQQGIFQEAFYNDTTEDGMLWIHSYGGHTELILKGGESKKVAYGLFIAADANLNYNVSTLKGAKSFFLGATTTLFKFEGPCKVYIHNKNYNNLMFDIIKNVPNRK